MAIDTSLATRLGAIANVVSGSMDAIRLDIDRFPALTSAYLYEAIRNNRLDIVISLIDHVHRNHHDRFSGNILDSVYGKMRLLSIAILHQHSAIVEWMVNNGANVDAGDVHSQKAPLHYAFEFGIEPIIQLLIARSANVNAIDFSHATCLHYACKSGNPDIVAIAANLSISVNDTDLNKAPLHYACEHGNKDIVHVLMEQCAANVNVLDSYKKTPLHYACESGNDAIIAVLIEKNANINALDFYKKAPLHYACGSGNETSARILVKHGGAVNTLDHYRRAPLHYACESGNEAIVRVLLEAGAVTSGLDNINAMPFHLACRLDNRAIVHMLLEYGASVDSLAFNIEAPLHYACGSKSGASIRMSAENDAPIDWLDNFNKTSLTCLLESGNEDYVKYLFEHAKELSLGAEILNDDSLSNALYSGHYGIAKVLIDNGANFEPAKAIWLANAKHDKRKLDLFFSRIDLFHQLNQTDRNAILFNGNYVRILDINLPDHILSSRLGCIFMLFSTNNVLSEIREECDEPKDEYFKFMFTRARLFLRGKWPCSGQDPKSISILELIFSSVFKDLDVARLVPKLDQACKFLTGPTDLVLATETHVANKQMWIQGYLRYPWAFIKVTRTNVALAAAIVKWLANCTN